MHCPHCGKDDIRRHERLCPKCDRDCGFPNVRQAEELDEQHALFDRLSRTTKQAETLGCSQVLDEFRSVVLRSKAIINRSLSKLNALVESDDTMFGTFYDLVGAGLKRSSEAEIEKIRKIADLLIFPGYAEHIRFATLSISKDGAPTYGACAIVLSEETIAHRASVFVQNSALYARDQSLGADNLEVPKGLRAVWGQRDQLAAAKLGGMLKVGTSEQGFQDILLRSDGKNTENDNFIEVHIYGAIHRSSIEKIVVPKSERRGNAALISEIISKLKPLGVSVEE